MQPPFERNLTDLMFFWMKEHMAEEKPDASLSIETHIFDVQAACQSMEFNFDVGRQLFLNVGRFSRLVKEYVPRTPFAQFVELCKTIVAGDARNGACAGFIFRDPKRSAKKHRWGGCLQSANFKRDSTGKFTFTMNSRTTYLGYMGHLDACLAYTMVSYITDPVNVQFLWNISSVQVHAFKSIPLILRTPEWFEILESCARLSDYEMKRLAPTWNHLARWYVRLLRDFDQYGSKMVEIEKYGPFRRVKRRWLEFKGLLTKNIPPSLPVQDLIIDKAIDDEGAVYGELAPDEDDDSDE